MRPIPVLILLGFFAIVALVGIAICHDGYVPRHATWNGKEFTCPANTELWADESEALAGKKDYAYCIPRRIP